MKPHINLFDAFFDIEQNPIVGMGPLMHTEKEGTGQLYCDVFFKHYAHRLRINVGMGLYPHAPASERFRYLDTQLDYEIVARGVKERFIITQLEFIHNLQDLKQTILDHQHNRLSYTNTSQPVGITSES